MSFPKLTTAALLLLATLTGCSHYVPTPDPGPRATDIDPVEATPEFWWNKPGQAKLSVADFDRGFEACQQTLHDYFFRVERLDSRAGVVTSQPMTTAQWFEPWRHDNTTAGDIARSSIGTYRRIVRFDISHSPDGRYIITPKVLIERQTVVGRRLGGVLGYQTFTNIDETALTADTDTGTAPISYWYSVGRDYNFEVVLADALIKHMY